MTTTSVTLSGFVYDNAGNAVQDATVTAYTSADNATSAISGLTDTTDANGRWDLTTTDEAKYPMDVKIVFGSSVRWIKAGNGINVTRLTVSGAAVFGENDTGVDVTMYGATSGRYLLWDESEDALHLNDSTELKIGTLAAGDMVLYHDGTNSYIKNATGALKIATESSGIAVTIGHTTSEVTVADNLTVTGDLTVSGTTVTVSSADILVQDTLVFEGTANAHETTLTIVDPTADGTIKLPAMSAGTYFLPVLDTVTTTAISATPAEINLIDGGTARGTTAIADGDGVLINDGGTMRMTTVETLATYMEGEINALSLGVTFSGASTFSNTLTVGVDDTGYDVKFFGATASAFMLWDESEDDLVLSGTAQLSIDTTTDASSTITGSFHTDGGVGIAKKLYVGTDLDVAGTSNIEDTVVLGTLTVGVDDTGHDVKFFGASAGAYLEWDESADQLRIMGASADATTSTGKLLLATSLTDVNANDVIGKIDFQAPHESDGTDAIEIAASIQAIAQGTFAANLNATDLIFYTGHTEAATEKFRFTSQGELGVGGANYGNDGQVLTSTGAGTAPAWEDVSSVTTASVATTVTITDNESTNESNAIIFTAGGDVDGGNIGLESDGDLTYNPSTGKITATGFIGALTGNADTVTTNANLTGDVTSSGNATAIASGVIVDADVNASAAIAVSKTALVPGTNISLSTNTLNVDDAFLTNTGDDTTDGTITAAGFTAAADGVVTLANEGKVKFTDTTFSDGNQRSSGITFRFTTSSLAIAIGQAVHLSGTTVILADADVASQGAMPCIGVAASATTGSGTENIDVLVLGCMRYDTYDFTVGSDVFVTATAGGLDETAPSTDGHYVQKVGIAISADILYVNPSLDVIEHA